VGAVGLVQAFGHLGLSRRASLGVNLVIICLHGFEVGGGTGLISSDSICA